jgi:hypothetical protein
VGVAGPCGLNGGTSGARGPAWEGVCAPTRADSDPPAGLTFLVFTGLPAIFIRSLDARPLVGDWLTDHVPFWDEVTDFYDWLFSHAS